MPPRQNGPGAMAGATEAGRIAERQAVSGNTAPLPTTSQPPRLNRETFRTSRLLEFCSGRELIAHRIRFTVGPIRQEPRISCDRASSSVKTGTRVTGRWPAKACSLLDDDGRFLPICRDYVALNPHLARACDLPDASIDWSETTAPNWETWRPSNQIPAHWYSVERLHQSRSARR